jgi:hypothetical protein
MERYAETACRQLIQKLWHETIEAKLLSDSAVPSAPLPVAVTPSRSANKKNSAASSMTSGSGSMLADVPAVTARAYNNYQDFAIDLKHGI